ncbi:OLC1v1015840C1 [Oldenlandia corymbosa var. corymbosa]|uniref:OLC1v1015840C1 n=1 Tax=Oldenlandia corymbosa var. corymbosa TaxID=529605 RepID=A0AAV1E713_OLDCO|nr:OLC1v1015840C1 [Oldenlandia corymbosa var. corymbosa]
MKNNDLSTDGEEKMNLDLLHNDCKIEISEGFEGKRQKKVYSRKELEGLRHVGIDCQRKRWSEIYCGLGPVVQQEYDDGLVDDDLIISIKPRSGKSPPLWISMADFELNRSNQNFNSGPLEDGLEYLRSVRYGATQVPQVKVAKVDKSRFNKVQTNYMPQIPDFAKCSEKLMPLKKWDDVFLSMSEDLRMELSNYGASGGQLQTSSSKLSEITLLKNFDSTSCEGDSCQSTLSGISQTNGITDCFSVAVNNYPSGSVESFGPKPSERLASVEQPTLSAIIQMDSVARVSALRKRIKMAESTSILSWNDCLWLFALSAAVDSPLDADTCASFRSLLRKCASLRAEKSVVDEEVAMLNILATIAGRYFGQLGNLNP